MTKETHHAAVAAIQFALSNPEGMEFLRLWNEGEFDILRRDWPEAPDSVYIGAESTPEDLQPSGEETTPPHAPAGVKTLSEFMAEQEALHPGIHDKVQAAADELRASSAEQVTGITATELGYALKRATPAQVIEYLEDDVNMRVALSIHFEEQQGQQPATVNEAQGVVDGWRLVVRYDEFDSEPSVWAEKDGSLVWIAALTEAHNE